MISTGPTTRLLITRWDTSTGQSLVSLAPQFRDRRGEWRLAHSAVTFGPQNAPEIAAAILEIAAMIDGIPEDPRPTPGDLEASRWP